ncbi:MAG: GNAT family N-acetyltransferase [Oscillospiraceae bacterium]|nr:GNAT family N-acetyltransferase [Oscillospiraceae bacterium]
MEFTLRRFSLEDVESVARYANNEKIACKLRDVFPHPYSADDAVSYIESCISRDEQVLCRAIDVEGAAIGSIGVFPGGDIYRKSAELGYWLGEEFWGLGIMSEAVRRICAKAFEKFDIVRIFAEPFAHNAGSRRVLEKAGFTCEGTMKCGVYKNGIIYDYCMYALLRE